MSKPTRPPPTGIRERHSRSCPANMTEGRCSCEPTLEASVYDRRSGRKIRKSFSGKAALTAAKAWRAEATSAVNRGTIGAPTATTLRDAWEAWLEGARAGAIRNRSGDEYKPSVLRSYDTSMRLRVLPDLGATKLGALRRLDFQDLADRMLAERTETGEPRYDASTIRNTLLPARVVCRRAIARGELAVNPTTALELPAVKGRRDRIASASEATELLDALPERDRATWACAFYAGLRRGELRGLRWDDVDLDVGVIYVRRSWDDTDGAIETKSRAGRRDVPIVAVLRSHLVRHRLASGWSDGFVFGRTATTTFDPNGLRARALSAWKKANVRRSEDRLPPLDPIGLHECRHTFASLLIAAGVNVKAISTYMGHSSITITLDRYGHLMPGHEAEAVEKIDAYLSSSNG